MKKLTWNTNTYPEVPSPNSTSQGLRTRTTGPDELQNLRCQPHWEDKGRTCDLVVTLLTHSHTASHFLDQWSHRHGPGSGLQVTTVGELEGGFKPTAVAWPRIKGIHSPYTTTGRVVGGSKSDHELQLCVAWQQAKLAILIPPNLKPPLCRKDLQGAFLPQSCRAACAPPTSSSLKVVPLASLGLGGWIQEGHTTCCVLSSLNYWILGQSQCMSSPAKGPILKSGWDLDSFHCQQMFAEHLLCSRHSWYGEYQMTKIRCWSWKNS